MDGPPTSSSHGSVAADVPDQGETSGHQSDTPSLRTLNPKLEEIHKEVESDRKEMHNVQLEIPKTEIDDLNHKLTEAIRVNSQLVSQNKFLQKDLDRTKGDLEKVNLDLEECKSRLSRKMSNALTENNTQITDLSDSNRPSKLGEKHSELYDNEWTDAFEELVKKYETDESAIKTLLAILKDVHTFCEVKSAEQTRT
ncbi:hypothetical protein DPMN_116255 [Dreissena polymorpha]|uniref:Uncharacterized protein n=1 Tax=Dreissena polymorpha TaxID=45954 RepID=A0A9D4KN98_DREPO|nr:hypothetical protein DPMN_116255 [Dreissena polymorpha]